MAKRNGPSSPRPPSSFTDTRRVKELIALMADNGLTEIELVEDKSRILLRRGGSGSVMPGGAAVAHGRSLLHAPPAGPVSPDAGEGGGPLVPPDAPRLEENIVTIKSPMVGTFYAAPNPESDPYVSPGADIEKDKTVVCVIEAMKVFNEIHADVTGTITRIFVSNGQTVEFGQPLFLVKPG